MNTVRLKRIHILIALISTVYIVWLSYFFINDQWHLFSSYWPMSLTMMLGSFVAGSSAIGGGGVAYPVLTKVLSIQPEDARTFSLMIQTVGMGIASVFIWARRIKVLWPAIFISSSGGMLGMVAGTFWLQIPTPYQKLTLTYVMGMFAIVLIYLTWGKRLKTFVDIKNYGLEACLPLFIVGCLGGILSANVGSGIDILVFIMLTLFFGIHEKVGTPSSVVIMAINAATGFFLHAYIVQDISEVAFHSWLVCVPIVALGAPLGSWVVSMARRHHIISFLLALISLELFTTLTLIPQNHASLIFSVILLITLSGIFWLMLKYRLHRIDNNLPAATGLTTDVP